ncbi:hypothetical protein B0A48_03077 [Cryoendolithus antarcticus]|uniref:Uncharacterized protein n=1 Tax=Cryoendolithus antarcticus TaxID=1507870 RepID=A0A1V8TM34_9PEZI|nr:hypothetical protein B0A48_03077 [Cryoendolithus antarcticus]
MPRPSHEELALSHQKKCTLCEAPRDVLVRCQIDSSGQWHFVCPGKCWKSVSGGVVDGVPEKVGEGYKYGGMWKNKHAGVSAKVPKRLKGKLTGRESVASSDSVSQTTDGERSQTDGASLAGVKKTAKRSKGRMARKGGDVEAESEGSEGSGGSEGSDGSDGSDGSNGSQGSEESDHGGGVDGNRSLGGDSTHKLKSGDRDDGATNVPSSATDNTTIIESVVSKQSQSDASTKAF